MSPIEIGAARPVGPVQVSTPKTTPTPSAAPGTEAAPPPESGAAAQIEKSSALDAGQAAPVDVERVKVIRHAIETGTYPVVPAKIADAMIAAGMLLRTAQ
ncbi:MAG: flagellar biosynthesis anti-sigma factor FlgM [Novosphingobium sp.]